MSINKATVYPPGHLDPGKVHTTEEEQSGHVCTDLERSPNRVYNEQTTAWTCVVSKDGSKGLRGRSRKSFTFITCHVAQTVFDLCLWGKSFHF